MLLTSFFSGFPDILHYKASGGVNAAKADVFSAAL
jgi:hypothetical protein